MGATPFLNSQDSNKNRGEATVRQRVIAEFFSLAYSRFAPVLYYPCKSVAN